MTTQYIELDAIIEANAKEGLKATKQSKEEREIENVWKGVTQAEDEEEAKYWEYQLRMMRGW